MNDGARKHTDNAKQRDICTGERLCPQLLSTPQLPVNSTSGCKYGDAKSTRSCKAQARDLMVQSKWIASNLYSASFFSFAYELKPGYTPSEYPT